MAVKLNRRPPLTTQAQRRILTSLSIRSPPGPPLRSPPPRLSPRSPRPRRSFCWPCSAVDTSSYSAELFVFGVRILEAQAAFAGPFGHGRHATVVLIVAAIERDFLDAGLHGPLGDRFADELGRV